MITLPSGHTVEERYCRSCDGVIPANKRDYPFNYRTKRYCSRTCYHDARRGMPLKEKSTESAKQPGRPEKKVGLFDLPALKPENIHYKSKMRLAAAMIEDIKNDIRTGMPRVKEKAYLWLHDDHEVNLWAECFPRESRDYFLYKVESLKRQYEQWRVNGNRRNKIKRN